MQELKDKIFKIIQADQLGVLATVTGDGKPMGRYVMTKSDEDLNLFAVTSISSRKIKQIENNPSVHVTLGFKPGVNEGYVSFLGKADVLTDPDSRRTFWDDSLKRYFKDVDDPEYCIIKMIPDSIEYWAGWEPEIWKP